MFYWTPFNAYFALKQEKESWPVLDMLKSSQAHIAAGFSDIAHFQPEVTKIVYPTPSSCQP